jgi:hypothetical protein
MANPQHDMDARGEDDDGMRGEIRQEQHHPSRVSKKEKKSKTSREPTRRNPMRKAKSMHAPYQKLTPIVSDDMSDIDMDEGSCQSTAPLSSHPADIPVSSIHVSADLQS